MGLDRRNWLDRPKSLEAQLRVLHQWNGEEWQPWRRAVQVRVEIMEELEVDAASWLRKALLVRLEWEDQRMEMVQIANSVKA